MAEVLDDGAFWLPPRFLTDDDLFMDGSKAKGNPKKLKDGSELDLYGSKLLFPYELPYGFESSGISSDPSSPVESVVGSTETESDEEVYLAGLTRLMALSTIHDVISRNDNAFASENPKGLVLSGSPQSTLCPLRSGCGCMQGSSRGSPTGKSRVSSPLGTWDQLSAAVGKVARMPMNEVAYGGFNRGLSRSPATKLSQNFDVSGFCQPPQSLSHQMLQAAQFQILKQQQQQLMKQQNASIWGGQKQQQPHYHHQVVQNRVRVNNGTNRPVGLSPSAWPTLQQQTQMPNESGMRAVFLGNPTAKRECAGTGVFLPRRIGAPSEPRKKPACPTVLLPARVVQALNLNLDEIGVQPQSHPRFNANFTADTDASLKLQSGGIVFANQKQRNVRQHQGINQEVGLPQEWTY